MGGAVDDDVRLDDDDDELLQTVGRLRLVIFGSDERCSASSSDSESAMRSGGLALISKSITFSSSEEVGER